MRNFDFQLIHFVWIGGYPCWRRPHQWDRTCQCYHFYSIRANWSGKFPFFSSDGWDVSLTDLCTLVYCLGFSLLTERHSFKCYFQTPVAPQSITFYPRINASLGQLIQSKCTQLCVAIDTNDSAYMLKLADKLGPKICALKLHLDILQFDCSPDPFISQLRSLAKNHGFLIVEDRSVVSLVTIVCHF